VIAVEAELTWLHLVMQILREDAIIDLMRISPCPT